jgi:general nucleoside transport system permease protein
MLQPILAVLLGLVLGLSATWIAGENPWHVLTILARGAFGSSYNLGMTLFHATPLIFTGLSVAVAFHAGLFNIGAEGQLTCGALAAAAVGAVWPGLGAPFAPVLAGLAALAAGTAWGAIPGWLRARRGSHEVISTIMLNFIAAGLASYVALYVLRNPESQNPETRPIGAGFCIPQFGAFGTAPVSAALPLALLAAALVWILLWRTVLGFEIRAVGQSESAARAAGINPGGIRIIAMSLAGGLAGLVAVGEVLGNAGKFRVGFSPEYGFMGIAVALLGRNQPAGVVAAALLFGALHNGATELDLETEHVTREVSLIFQALIILSVSAEGVWHWMKLRRHEVKPAEGIGSVTEVT